MVVATAAAHVGQTLNGSGPVRQTPAIDSVQGPLSLPKHMGGGGRPHQGEHPYRQGRGLRAVHDPRLASFTRRNLPALLLLLTSPPDLILFVFPQGNSTIRSLASQVRRAPERWGAGPFSKRVHPMARHTGHIAYRAGAPAAACSLQLLRAPPVSHRATLNCTMAVWGDATGVACCYGRQGNFAHRSLVE